MYHTYMRSIFLLVQLIMTATRQIIIESFVVRVLGHS